MDKAMSVRAWRTGDAGTRLLVANLEAGSAESLVLGLGGSSVGHVQVCV
jgi:hypothetical protein